MAELDDSSPCPVNGQHSGVPMGKVPSQVLDWYDGQPWLEKKYPEVKRYIARVRKAINQDLERGER